MPYLFVALNIIFFPMLTTFICATALQKQEVGFRNNKHE